MAGSPGTLTSSAAQPLACWATALDPSEEDLALAQRSLFDTAAVMVAARDDPVAQLFRSLSEVGRQAALAHVLDYDDLHRRRAGRVPALATR